MLRSGPPYDGASSSGAANARALGLWHHTRNAGAHVLAVAADVRVRATT